MIEELLSVSTANRINQLERLQEFDYFRGDFSGSVTGTWVRLGANGEGVVSYANKTYATKPIGFLSIPAGTEVELTFAKGIYYSNY